MEVAIYGIDDVDLMIVLAMFNKKELEVIERFNKELEKIVKLKSDIDEKKNL